MRDAMRARDECRTQTLRMAMSAAHNRQTGRVATDDDYLDVLGKQLKQRRESIEAFRAGDREAMAASEEAEAVILAEFLPEPMTEAELETVVRAAIAETGAAPPADLGRRARDARAAPRQGRLRPPAAAG